MLSLSHSATIGVLLFLCTCAAAFAAPDTKAQWPDPRFTVGPLLFQDDFTNPQLTDWVSELEAGGTVSAAQGALTVDVPRGATVWYRTEITGPVLIEYEATVIKHGGPNDRVSDLNCFWMAQDPAHPGHLLSTPRTGKFTDYDTLTTYYVGQGGNTNTTTRFRRYIGKAGNRPLRPEDDLRTAETLLVPNAAQTIRLVAFGNLIQYYHDNLRLFELHDKAPYTHGWFGLRTTDNHLQVRHFRVYRLLPVRE